MAFQDLQALPEPVLRYFKYCLKEGQRPVKFCALKQRGAFRCLPDLALFLHSICMCDAGLGLILPFCAKCSSGCDADIKLVPPRSRTCMATAAVAAAPRHRCHRSCPQVASQPGHAALGRLEEGAGAAVLLHRPAGLCVGSHHQPGAPHVDPRLGQLPQRWGP